MRAVDRHRKQAEMRLYGHAPQSRARSRTPSRRRKPTVDASVRRRRILWALGGVLFFLCLLAIYTSPALVVRRVRLIGLAHVTADEAQQAQQSAAIPARTNLFRARTKALEARIGQLPWVAKAEVHRRLPGTLEVRVTPRATEAVLAMPGGKWEVDGTGRTIRSAREGVAAPEINLSRDAEVHPGAPVADEEALAAVSTIVQVNRQMACHIAKIAVDQNDELCLNMQDNTVIRLGQVDDLSAKLALIRRIYEEDPGIGTEVQVVDVRCPDAPVCIPRTAARVLPQAAASTDDEQGSRSSSSRVPLRGPTD